MSNNFSLNMNTRQSECINNYLNKNNNKMFQHQFDILNNKNPVYLENHGMNNQNDFDNKNVNASTKLRNSKILKKKKKN